MLCDPKRLSLVSYIFEYAFLYDNVLESVSKALLDAGTDHLVLDEIDYRTVRSVTGTKQIQSKILLELLSIDKPCAEVVIDAWKVMVGTTAACDKSCIFYGLDDFVEYRIIDTEELVAPIARPCFAALGLANDYFSLDIEWEEFQKTQKSQNKCYNDESHVALYPLFTPNSAKYLKALAFQMPGNVAWSLRCPRYHPERCSEAEGLLHPERPSQENYMDKDIRSDNVSDTKKLRVPSMARSNSESGDSCSSSEDPSNSTPSSRTSVHSEEDIESSPGPKGQVELGDKILIAPFEYNSSLPSKGVREALIDALNVWLTLPDSTVKTIKLIAQKLHSSSLMLDDIEGYFDLRRGNPASHTIFGSSSTINCANFLLIDVLNDVHKLGDPNCMAIVLEELKNLFIGQSFDLYWTRQGECPSEDEYMEMVNQKTGGLFRLLGRLMCECAQSLHKKTIPLDLMLPLGQYFQIRDDYKNLIDDVYTSEKGLAEDLDEGKFSFPIIAAMNTDTPNLVLQGILRESRNANSLSVPHKKIVLDKLHKEGSMKHTVQTLKWLEADIQKELKHVEKESGCENWVMRLLIQKLVV
ncbi:geranylgeranyl pyrophosphate synthase [Penicillium argentinense]|uniref:Geranylgeranyl pyrophosphate synthase n=1 Tax=Penicillium argentinense TaxID=1131581 RepID=A0A9W9F7M1_9EURO|nr:geranylgeranyl pyrophosphate synthase [Penicillium argentinense]KAJ5094984.1 geranylgeranyl pyrophosphate synthase [Penicillium argentinense]